MSQRNVFYYDAASNLICVRDPDLGLTSYRYDLLDRLVAVKNPAGEVTYYDYNLGGQVKTRKLGNHTLVWGGTPGSAFLTGVGAPPLLRRLRRTLP